MRAIALGILAALFGALSVSAAADEPVPVSPPSTVSAPQTATQQAVIAAVGAAADASKAGDYKKAYAILKPWADQGFFGPMYSVAYMDLQGQGTTKDVKAGLDLLTASANAGYFESQSFLAVIYLTGYEVQSDYPSWYKWMDMAYKQDTLREMNQLGGIRDDLNAVAQGWVAFSLYAEVPKNGDYSIVFQWASVSAANKGAIGEYVLGTLYDNGQAVVKDDEAAAKLFTESAAQDLPIAENDLGALYEQGSGVPRDFSHALKLYTQAANHGYMLAQFNLCRTYGSGRGVPVDVVQAYKWCNLAAAQGDTDANGILDTIQAQMTLDQINEAQRLSAAWKQIPWGANVNPAQENSSAPQQSAKRKQRQTVASASKGPKLQSSGTGFYVTTDGYLVTNAHVIDACAEIHALSGNKIDKLTLVVEDVADDLALLSSNEKPSAAAIFRDGSPIQIGEHLVVFGYPLPDVLSGQLTLTDGSVSALGGIGGAVNEFQFSAPIQPGNSGGPILDVSGRVVGMSAAKLNSITMAKVTGDVPQNVNFAINEQTLRTFLDIHSVHYGLSKTTTPILDTTLGQQAKNYAVMLQCWK